MILTMRIEGIDSDAKSVNRKLEKTNFYPKKMDDDGLTNDWRDHVEPAIIDVWTQLTPRERYLVYLMAESAELQVMILRMKGS